MTTATYHPFDNHTLRQVQERMMAEAPDVDALISDLLATVALAANPDRLERDIAMGPKHGPAETIYKALVEICRSVEEDDDLV